MLFPLITLTECGMSSCTKVGPISDYFPCSDLTGSLGITFLIRVGLTLVNCCRRQILECRDEKTLLELIHHPPPKLLPPNPDTLITLALNQKVKDDDIRKQRVKMEAQVKRHTQSQAPRKSTAPSAISLPRTDSFH